MRQLKDDLYNWEKQNDEFWKKEKGSIYDVDVVNHPPHYNKGKYETIDVIVDTLGDYEAISYCQGNCIKYLIRMWHKGSALENAEKCLWYLNKMIELLKKTKGKNW